MCVAWFFHKECSTPPVEMRWRHHMEQNPMRKQVCGGVGSVQLLSAWSQSSGGKERIRKKLCSYGRHLSDVWGALEKFLVLDMRTYWLRKAVILIRNVIRPDIDISFDLVYCDLDRQKQVSSLLSKRASAAHPISSSVESHCHKVLSPGHSTQDNCSRIFVY